MTTKHMACACALAVVTAACGHDRASNSITTLAIVAPATTVPATSGAPMSTVATTRVPPTAASAANTAPLTARSPETQALAAAVTRDWLEFNRRFSQSQMDPNNEAALHAALEYSAGDWIEHTRRYVQRMRGQRLRLLPEPQADATPVVESEPVPVSFKGDEVLLVSCVPDPWIAVQSLPGGGEWVVNDRLWAFRVEARLRFVEPLWKTVHTNVIAAWEGTCE